MLIYKIESDAKPFYTRDINEVTDFTRAQLEGACAPVTLCTVSVVEMTQEEVDALPDWEP